MLCVFDDVPCVLSFLLYIGTSLSKTLSDALISTFRMPGVSAVLETVFLMVATQSQETQSAQTTPTVSVGEPK